MASLGQMSKENQLSVLGVLFLVMCFFFYLYMISPVRTQIAALETEVETLRQEISHGQIVRVQLEQVKKAVADQTAQLNELRSVLPDEKETAEIILQVQQLAEQSNLRIRSFTPRATINNVFYEEWPILIALEGDYHNLGDFFQKISQFERLINIDNISIQAIENETSPGRTLGASCSATTFVFLENAPLGDQGGGNS